MKYKSLTYNNKTLTKKFKIDEVLLKHNFQWIIDSEIENAELEIERDTLLWNDGTWYSGTWLFGVWRGGTWKSGIWLNGIWEGGTWERGKFKSGIKNE